MAKPDSMTIAIDAMGADHGPATVIEGLNLAQKRYQAPVDFLICGDNDVLMPLVKKYPELRYDLRHTASQIKGDDQPSKALRLKEPSSMHLALEAVREGKAEGMISAGNTGALMVLTKHILRTLPGVRRPVMASVIPTLRSESVILDVGANMRCNEEDLFQFAMMGALLSRSVCGFEDPSVGLLNVGTEASKGLEMLKKADEMLKIASGVPFSYYGFIEGFDIPKGTVDIVVTDGFTGNTAIKSIEGTIQTYHGILKNYLSTSLLTKIGYLLISPNLKQLMRRISPQNNNGGIFLGLNGICVKSHGGCNAFGFSHAVTLGIDLIANQISHKINSEMQAHAARFLN